MEDQLYLISCFSLMCGQWSPVIGMLLSTGMAWYNADQWLYFMFMHIVLSYGSFWVVTLFMLILMYFTFPHHVSYVGYMEHYDHRCKATSMTLYMPYRGIPLSEVMGWVLLWATWLWWCDPMCWRVSPFMFMLLEYIFPVEIELPLKVSFSAPRTISVKT